MFLYTASLSQNTLVGPSIGTPNIRSLYLRASVSSTAVFIARNSAPKVLVSTVGWRLLYQCIGALLQKIRTPVWLRLFFLSPARSASTNADVDIECPLDSGILVGIASLASL